MEIRDICHERETVFICEHEYLPSGIRIGGIWRRARGSNIVRKREEMLA